MKRNKLSSARRTKRAKSQSVDRVIDMIKPLSDKYFRYILSISKETPESERKKLVMAKLEDMNKKWVAICKRKKWDKNRIKPQYQSFADYIIYVTKTRRSQIKTNIKVIEHPIHQRIVRAFWSIFVPSRFDYLEKALKSGMAWKYAYKGACKTNLW